MKCPYCKQETGAECSADIGHYNSSDFGNIGDDCEFGYYEEYLCKCPNCGEHFYWIERYVMIADAVKKREEWE